MLKDTGNTILKTFKQLGGIGRDKHDFASSFFEIECCGIKGEPLNPFLDTQKRKSWFGNYMGYFEIMRNPPVIQFGDNN